MMKKAVLCLLLWAVVSGSFAQLVRKKDYDAAFALQLGGETGMLTSFGHAEIALRPLAGLKMTFPFNRKWFLGSEINYSELKYKCSGELEEVLAGISLNEERQAEFDIKQIQVPLYLKYMLNCNKASVVLGFYGAYVFDSQVSLSSKEQDTDITGWIDNWHAGITLGYEHRIVKHFNIMCRIDAGLKEVVKKHSFFKDKLLPIQASITLSYDIFRVGDCGCD